MGIDRDGPGGPDPWSDGEGSPRVQTSVADYPTGPTRNFAKPSELLDAPQILPSFDTGAMVEHYRIMRLLGHGGMGEVYLARDTKLGRKIALKVVHSKYFGSEQARLRFLFEARTTARFNHPHIVTVYAVGEFEGRPYLALEYVEGEDLKTRMAERRLSLQESLRIGYAVALALVEAHSNDVLHRDLKPGNVRIGLDGRVRVLDFGLAKVTSGDGVPTMVTMPGARSGEMVTASGRRTVGMGTPPYMAPEQWREEPCTEAADIWALGVMLFLMLAHQLPYHEPTMVEQALAVCSPEPAPRLEAFVDVPQPLADLVAWCLAKRVTDRPSAAQVVDALGTLMARSARAESTDEDPFRGLLPFTTEHARLFFGRDGEIASFVERARLQPVLPVVGPSACGKSSFVRAGVIPRLREQEPWIVFQLRPGARPFHALAARLLGIEGEPGLGSAPSTGSGLDEASQALRDAGIRVETDPDEDRTLAIPKGLERAPRSQKMTERLLLPDGPASAERQPGWAGRAGTLRSPRGVETLRPVSPGGDPSFQVHAMAVQLAQWPRKLSLELRRVADERRCKVLLFVDQLEELFTLTDDTALQHAFMEAICTATDDALDPVRVVFTVREDFLGRLVTGPEVRDALGHVTVIQRPDPFTLQHILRRPVEQLQYSYEDPGLVDEMVASVANEPACLPLLQFTARVLWEQRDRSRRLLLRAVYQRIGGVEGALAQHADGVLQGFSAEELALARQLLLRLVTPERTRAVVPQQQALEGLGPQAPHVLGRLTQARLVSITKQSAVTGGQAVLELTHGSLIHNWSTLARWLDESREEVVLFQEVRQAAELWKNRGRRAEDLWQGHQLATAQRRLAPAASRLPGIVSAFLQASHARTRSKQRRRFAGIAAVVVVSISVAAAAVALALFVREQRDAAEQRRAEALREGARAALGQGSVLEARAKLREALEAEDSTAARALWWQLRDSHLWWQRELGSGVLDVAFAPDSESLVAATQSGPLVLVETRTGMPRILRGHHDQALSVAFAPDGRTLASGSADQTARIWSVETGVVKHTLGGHGAAVHAVAFSMDGKLVASAGADGTIRTWDASTGQPARSFEGHAGAVRAVAFSPDDKLLVSGGADRVVRLWDAQTGKARSSLNGHEREIQAVAFSPDGKWLATAGQDGTVRIWKVEGGEQLLVLSGHRGEVRAVGFSPDGRRVGSAGADRTVRIWLLPGGSIEQVWQERSEVWALGFSPDGRALATGSSDRWLRVHLLAAAGASMRPEGQQGSVLSAALSPDGSLAASGGMDGAVRLWDVPSGRVQQVLGGHADAVRAVTFSPDGTLLASASADRTIRLWNPRTGEELRVLSGHQGEVKDVRFSPDGRMLVSGSYDRTVRLWDAPSGLQLRVYYGHADRVEAVAFSPDTRWLASASHDRTARIWSPTPRVAGRPLRGHLVSVMGVGFDSGTDQVVTVDVAGEIRLWDPLKGPGAVLGRTGARTIALEVHPTGKSVGVAGTDGLVQLWDLETRKRRAMRGHRGDITSVRFDAKGERAVTASGDGTVRVWDVATGQPFWRAPALLLDPPRLMSHRGWTLVDEEPARLAEQEPLLRKALEQATAWRSAIEKRARFVSPSPNGELLCMLTDDDGVELWDRTADRRLVAATEPALEEVLATSDGCAARARDALWLHDRAGKSRAIELAGAPTALGWVPKAQVTPDAGARSAPEPAGKLIVAAGNEALLFDVRGQLLGRRNVSPGATAIAATDAHLLLGYSDGSIDMVPTDPTAPTPSFAFEKIPASPVLRILPGPMGTLFVGYANGLLGVWDSADGTALRHARLHGAVVHLQLGAERLYAASELGGSAVWDLRTFYQDRCSLLREVWSAVPIVWQRGRPVEQAPPGKHPCR